MATAAIVLLFLLMLTAPCVLALRSAEQGDEPDEIAVAETVVAKAAPATVRMVAAVKPPTLEEMAAEAELDALVARDLARDAHWAALAAQARAARLRADFEAEAEIVAEMEYFDLPRVPARGRAA